ncbi:group 1 truncated hemoglobin [Taibaiella sp. KBW10]|uniref:group 1 truncated hemoglobin n=1 Tax=Taibaiella sp. KBW10 TaxID=2153357 RepID=UPI000F5AA0C5|nr:group 1 truncated hemoglobin [Taibaiella sp. KBW10]
MNTNLKKIAIILLAAFSMGAVTLSSTSCKKKTTTPTPLATSPLYDTLGWFIQGGTGMVEGNGTKMINDPDNPGKTIQAGRLAIRKVVDKSLMVIAGDNRLAEYFPTLLAEVGAGNTTGYNDLLESFTDFVQQAVSTQAGVYTGKSMRDAHNHATYSRFGSTTAPKSSAADFDVFVGDVASAATSLSVPNSVIGQLGALLYTTKNDIVN